MNVLRAPSLTISEKMKKGPERKGRVRDGREVRKKGTERAGDESTCQ